MIRLLIVTAGGLGFLRPFPGTWGSLPPAVLAAALLLGGATAPVYLAALIALLAASSIACLALGAWAELRFGRKDASPIVIDEVAGQSLALLALPVVDQALIGAAPSSIALAVGAGFILFRALDIWKPPPARSLQRLPAGRGILIDDLIAGLYAGAILHLTLWRLR